MEKNLSNDKKKVLILGASSDIGIKVVQKFLDNNWEVLAHSNRNKKNLLSIKNKILPHFFCFIFFIIFLKNN